MLRNRLPRTRVLLMSLVFALAWYFFSFRWMFRSVMPLVYVLHVERATMLGHLVYGTALARYPTYLERLVDPEPLPQAASPVAAELVAEAQPQESAPAEPQ